jgi:hypothetical protein
VYAELTSAKDATLVAVVSDVDPAAGTSNQVTAGFLLASQRALDPDKSTYSRDGQLIRPWHPFTRQSQQAVIQTRSYRYQPSEVVVQQHFEQARTHAQSAPQAQEKGQGHDRGQGQDKGHGHEKDDKEKGQGKGHGG